MFNSNNSQPVNRLVRCFQVVSFDVAWIVLHTLIILWLASEFVVP